MQKRVKHTDTLFKKCISWTENTFTAMARDTDQKKKNQMDTTVIG